MIVLLLICAALVAAATATPAWGIATDGHLDPEYGVPVVIQTNSTAADDPAASNAGSIGWELDAAYGLISNGLLHLMFPGNMLIEPNAIDPGTLSSRFELFIDAQPNGQNLIQSNVYPVSDLSGLAFDVGFAPEFFLEAFASGGPDFSTPYRLEILEQRFASGAWSSTYMGGVVFGTSGALTGGSNPDAIEAAIDNSNQTGLVQGCGAGSPGPVGTGIEFAIPLAALGNPSTVPVCAFYRWGSITNQVLGPLPVGTCNLGAPNTVDFASISGNQYFTLSTPATVPPDTYRSFLALRTNPDRGIGVVLQTTEGMPARVEVIDLAGRRVVERAVASNPVPQTLTLATPGALPAGVYLVRLIQGVDRRTVRAVVVN